MKKIITLLLLLPLFCEAQYPPAGTYINQRYLWVAGAFRDGLHPPAYNGFPVNRTGVAPNNGNIAVDTVSGKLYVRFGNVWRAQADSASVGGTAWSILGNAGTSAPTNFIGTTDNQHMALRTNNTERMRVLGSGAVGINTTTPDSTLTVIGGFRVDNGAAQPGYVWTAANVDGRGTWAVNSSALGQRFGVSGEDNNGGQNRTFDASRFAFTMDSLNSYTVRSFGSIADSAVFRIQINRATEKHLLSEYDEPNNVRFAKVELGTDDPQNVYVINEVRLNGTSVASTVLESFDSSMSFQMHKLHFDLDTTASTAGIDIGQLKTAPSSTNLQALTRDSVTGMIYRYPLSSGGGSSRFGVSGEDDAAGENRSFDGGGTHSFELVNLAETQIQSDDAISMSAALGISLNTVAELNLSGSNQSMNFRGDTGIVTRRLGYATNIHGSLQPLSFITARYFDSLAVKLTGNQTIAGVKTFSSNPILSSMSAQRILYTTTGGEVTSNSTLVWDGQTLSATGGAFGEFRLNAGSTNIRLGSSSGNYTYVQSANGEALRFYISGTNAGTFNSNAEFIVGTSDNGSYSMQNNGALYNTGNAVVMGAFMPNNSAGTSGQILTSAGAGSPPTWSTPTTVTAGSTTPTLTNGANVDASTAYKLMWSRTGNIIHFSGLVEIDATLISTTTVIEIALPVASNFGASTDAAGTVIQASSPNSGVGVILASAANDRILISITPTSTSAIQYSFSGSYEVI